LVAKIGEDQMGTTQQANIHEVDDFVNLDDIVLYTCMNHDVTRYDDNKINDDTQMIMLYLRTWLVAVLVHLLAISNMSLLPTMHQIRTKPANRTKEILLQARSRLGI
jgi:hypothetical protein